MIIIIRCLFFCCFFCQIYAQDLLIVGIAGGTGSGKTTLANELQRYFSDSSVLISQDSYYHDLSHLSPEERSLVNFDHPNSLDFELLKDHLIHLKQGQSIEKPIYDFVSHSRVDTVEIIDSAPIIIVEGILLFAAPELRDLFDLKIFIDTDDDIRIMRRLERDIHERGRDFASVKNQYFSTVKPMHNQFVEPSKTYADVVVWGVKENLSVVTGLVSSYLHALRPDKKF